MSIVLGETRSLAEEWTYRYLAAARAWATTEPAIAERIGGDPVAEVAPLEAVTQAPGPTTSEVRRWAVAVGIEVPDRGRLRPEIWRAWSDAHQQYVTERLN